MASRLVLLGGADGDRAAAAFTDAGCDVRVLGERAAAELRETDARWVRYTLVHVGPDDGEPGGSFERAHHRTTLDAAPRLAEQLRPRERPLVRCLAFGYQQGLPEDPTWLVDVRFLDNPYWVDELRPLTGKDEPVRRHVLDQPAAVELLDRLESDLRWALPRYGRDRLTVAFGCTGGRHRSVVLAAEMAGRLAGEAEWDVEFEARELGP
ncbi:MAG: hypothetical protein J2P40_03080 [Candidatus Dormibacteraeota bacterium]|nr:hypothetical protein [Candidatus Dormibacteraeota bacterium]MBO0760238.1 hypothetical protein [Candidatus Dormibacteraeota bacterium]